MVLESEVNAERYNLGEEGMTLGLVQINRTCVCVLLFPFIKTLSPPHPEPH